MQTIYIADALPLIAEGIQKALSTESGFCVSGVFSARTTLVEELRRRQPDILFLDMLLEGNAKRKEDRPFWSAFPEVKTILLCTEAELNLQLVRKSFTLGAKSCLLRCIPPAELIQAVQTVAGGNTYIQESVRRQISDEAMGIQLRKPIRFSLTRREKEVLRLIIEEYTTQEIADELFISFCTVETHRKNLILKFGVKNTAGIVREALRLHLYPEAVG